MDRFLLVVNQFKEGSTEIAEEMKDYLLTKGKEVECVYMDNRIPDIREDTGMNAQGVIVLGGDGTILRTAYRLVHRDQPILGINMGHLGYLADVEAEQFRPALDALMEDNYVCEKRMMIKGKIIRDGEVITKKYALNDIVISRSGGLQVLTFDVGVNDQALKSYSADGVIVATPTGSTAYNLSAGGPIVEPSANMIILTPVAPHTMMNRSIIFKPEDVIRITIAEPHDLEMKQFMDVNFDGIKKYALQTGDVIEVTRSRKTVTLISLKEKNFIETLYRKMQEI